MQRKAGEVTAILQKMQKEDMNAASRQDLLAIAEANVVAATVHKRLLQLACSLIMPLHCWEFCIDRICNCDFPSAGHLRKLIEHLMYIVLKYAPFVDELS